jgi:hypothetical protein
MGIGPPPHADGGGIIMILANHFNVLMGQTPNQRRFSRSLLRALISGHRHWAIVIGSNPGS